MSRLAVGLRKQIGLVDGDVMIVDLPNSIQFCEIMLACASIGVVFSPVNPLYHSGKLEKKQVSGGSSCDNDHLYRHLFLIHWLLSLTRKHHLF